MNQLTDFDRRYLELVLEIDNHIDGYIDAYIGPDNLQADAAGRAARPVQQLKEDVTYLAETIPTADPARHGTVPQGLPEPFPAVHPDVRSV